MAQRKDEKQRRREEREQKERERLEAERRKKLFGLAVGGVLVLAVIGVIVFVIASGGSDAPARKTRDLAKAATLAKCTVKSFKSEGRQHTTATVSDYKTNPPTSGPHNPQPAQDGEYDSAPAKEAFVHTLEHGRVEIQYKPGTSSKAKDALKSVFEESTDKMLLFPNNTGMPYEVAATAWTHMVACPKYNDRVPDALRAFRDKYRGKGPENVP
jgi:hypothetical protein